MARLEPARRRRLYFVMMGICIALIVVAWNVVRFFSTPAAIAMSVVAAVIPPAASIVANLGAMEESARRDGRPVDPPRPDPDR